MKKPVLFSVFVAVLSLVDASAALEARRSVAPGSTTWVRSSDEGRFTLDKIGTDENGWPTILSHRVFKSAAESENASRHSGFFSSPLATLFAHDEASAVELVVDDPKVKPLWEVRNDWSNDWEMKYGEWVEKNIDRDFFVKTNQASDCADLAYSARWIFARENGLPMANRISGTGDFFTQRSVKPDWMKLPTDPTNPDWTKDTRFRAALNYLLSLTYTHSLMDDSYPIALDSTTFRAGVHHLALTAESGHTLLIHRTDFANPGTLPFIVLYSDMPIVVRPLFEQAYFYTDQPKPDTGGFLRMRWPVFAGGKVSLRAAKDMPWYSTEQYETKIMEDQSSFGLAVMRKLKPTFSLVIAIREAINGVRDMITDRVKTVEDGYAICSKIPGGCSPTSPEYDSWSTPARDARILAQAKLVTSMSSLGNSDERKQMDAIVTAEMKKPVITLFGEPLNLNIVYQAFRHGLASSDPNQPIELRWSARPEAFVELFKTRFSTGYAERANAMATAGTKCRGNTSEDCAIGGATYLQENSFAVDTKLKEPAMLLSAYCRETGESDSKCVRLHSLLATTKLAIGSETKSLSEWIDSSLDLNSDPRVSLARRNGQGPLTYAKLEITGAHEFRLMNGVAFVRDRSTLRGTFYDRKGNAFVSRPLPAGLIALDASLGENRGLFGRGNQLVLADLHGAGEIPVVTSSEAVAEARLLGLSANGRERILVFTAKAWRVLEAGTTGTWSEILKGGFDSKASLDPKFDREMLVFQIGIDPAKGWSLVDLRAEKPKALPFDGVPSADSGRQNYALNRAIYLQVTQTDSDGEVLRTIRVDRPNGTLALAWGLRGYVGHVTNDDRTAYFGDKVGDLETFYEASVDVDGKLGARTRLSGGFYRQLDYIIFYGGIPDMILRAITADGTLVPIALQAGEEWFKHVRGDSIVLLLKDGGYGIRKVSGGGLLAEDGFLAMPLEGTSEAPYRYLSRIWKASLTGTRTSGTFASLTDDHHPERFAIQTGMLLGDPYENAYEPWSADSYAGVDSVAMDSGTVFNLGARAYWIGD